MKNGFISILLFLSGFYTAQNSVSKFQKPKLVVGIVVDQMRHDYIYRYWDRYGSGGFKRLIQKGYFYKNTQYNYVPTYTGPGHASIYTGSTPATHGIIANDWFLKNENKTIYCTEDKTVKTIGSESKAGLMSPKNMLTTTIGDELKLSNNQKSKVIAVSLKDRSSILPGGHSANAAYWFDGSCGKFITSTYYMNQLPDWLNHFNQLELAKKYLTQGWNTLYPLSSYTASISDDNHFEKAPNKKEKPIFPYEYKSQIENNDYDIIRATPYGNTLIKDLAISCLKNEGLGKGPETDLLCVSFSSTDYVGHSYGPRSVEIEDVYLRLDKDLEALLNSLDSIVGKNNYLLFLTADHGACDVPNYLIEQKIPAGYIKSSEIEKMTKEFCVSKFGDSLIYSISNQQVFLNEKKITSLKLNKNDIEKQLADYLITIPGIAEAYPSEILKYQAYPEGWFKHLIQKGYNHVRSGNIAFSYNPAWMEYMEKGTTHGAAYSYDTHVPLIFYGLNIPAGQSVKKVSIVDIAPTLSMLLQISFPNGCNGKPLEEVIK